MNLKELPDYKMPITGEKKKAHKQTASDFLVKQLRK
jgi:hypothetical protein